MNKKVEQRIDNIENANFIILNLIQKLSVLSQNCDETTAQTYKQQILQLQKDLKHLDNPQIFAKVQNAYMPYLKQLLETDK